jgi:diacylglycerol kinase (ATP)
MIIVNPDSTQGKSAMKYFVSRSISFEVSERKEDMERLVLLGVKKGVREFFIVSGDGGVNRCVHAVMGLPEKVRREVVLGVLPGGKANDCARHLGLPMSIGQAYEKLVRGDVKRVDVIRVNQHYFITGGGFGLTPEVIEGVDRLSAGSVGRFLNKVHRGLVYQLVVLGKALFGFRGLDSVWIDDTRFDDVMLFGVMNQPFHGKSYVIAPGARVDDGLVDVVLVRKPKGLFGRLRVLKAVSHQKHLELAGSKRMLKKRFVVRFSQPHVFVGDGELFKTSKVFEFEVLRGGIGLLAPEYAKQHSTPE